GWWSRICCNRRAKRDHPQMRRKVNRPTAWGRRFKIDPSPFYLCPSADHSSFRGRIMRATALTAGCFLWVLSGWVMAGELPPPPAKTVDFARDVEPILAKNCMKCHGPKKKQGGLALDSRASALAGGDNGPALVPGKSAESRLIRYVAG